MIMTVGYSLVNKISCNKLVVDFFLAVGTAYDAYATPLLSISSYSSYSKDFYGIAEL